MKIGIISLYFKPVSPGMGNRISQITAQCLSELGHTVVVHTANLHENLNDVDNNGKITFKRLWVPPINHQSNINRFIINSVFFIQCFFQILFCKKTDALLCFVPYLPFFGAVLVPAKLKKIKSIIFQADLWPDVLRELGLVKNRFWYGVLSRICIWTYNQADYVFAMTPELKQSLENYAIKPKIIILEQGIDQETFKPRVNQKDHKFQVLYAGSYSPLYDFDTLLQSALRLQHDDIEFVFLGDGMLKNKIQNSISRLQLKSARMENAIQNVDEFAQRLCSADVLVVAMKDMLQNNTTYANKLFEYMACGRPVVVAAKGSPRNLVLKSGGGFVVDIGDVDSLANTIKKLYHNPKLCAEMGLKGSTFVQTCHSIHSYKTRLQEILDSMF